MKTKALTMISAAAFMVFAVPYSASAMTCGEWLASRETDSTINNRAGDVQLIISFSLGYITALNETSKGFSNVAATLHTKIPAMPDIGTVLQGMDNGCRQNRAQDMFGNMKATLDAYSAVQNIQLNNLLKAALQAK
jgi:hypothetical protein